MHRRGQAGFTLIELMMVVAIVAVIATILISVNSRTYGSNAKNVGDQVSATLNMVKSRAVATRRIHRAFIRSTEIQVWASDTTGITDDNDPSDDLFVLRMRIPHGVTVWNVLTTVNAAAGANPSQATALDYELKFKPDGSSNGGTVFLHDTNDRKYRMPIYKATGSVYSRANW